MGIEGISALKADDIVDMKNFIQARQRKGQTATEIAKNLEGRGYDYYAARGLVMLHWEYDKTSEEQD